jgi:hypothetical protein
MKSRTPCDAAVNRLRGILLDHLRAAGVAAWPGCDGLTVEAVLGDYPEAVAAGDVPDREQLLGQHPELAEALRAWPAAQDRWQFAARALGPTERPGA